MTSWRQSAARAVVVGACALAAVGATEIPSADQVLKQMENGPATKPAAEEPKLSPFQKELKAFVAESPKLAPADAAKRWLDLVDKSFARDANAEDATEFAMRQSGGVFSALPAPASWKEIARLVEARPAPAGQNAVREEALRLYAHLLVQNEEALKKDLTAMDALLGNASMSSQLRAVMLSPGGADDPQAKVREFTEQLAANEAGNGTSWMQVPDLVTLAGKEKAEELLRRVLLLPERVHIEIETGDATVSLARQVALANVDKLKAPPWKLVDSLDAVDLYEALERKFPPPNKRADDVARAIGSQQDFSQSDDSERHRARFIYLLGLIAKGRTDDAMKVAKGFNNETGDYETSEGLKALERAGASEAAYKFLTQALTENPELALWDQYTELGAKLGKSDEVLAAARKAAAREGLTPKQRMDVKAVLTKALFAADQNDEAGALLRERVKAGTSPGEVFEPAKQLANIGNLLGHHDWVDEAVVPIIAHLKSFNDPQRMASNSWEFKGGIQTLRGVGRSAQTAELIADAMAKAYQAAKGPQARPGVYFSGSGSPSSELPVELLGIYHGAGRTADVVGLLDRLPNWGASDLVEFYEGTDSSGNLVGYMAAAALVAQGRNDEASPIIRAILNSKGGYDPAYELLLKIDGEKSIPLLDELFSRDRFEERPLIWKATILLEQKKLDDAQKTIEQAIAIDPSDGEQGKGSRMRAYSVYADVLDAKGDAKKAALMREAVKAIRLSENADSFYDNGLLRRAIKMYEEALGHFSDAYCIQSRLAIQMAKLGMYEMAAEHYRKAYELMPESFGRVESHCFGCEHAFESAQAQGIAEKVFSELAQKEPAKPQVHYLLGYLRILQDRYSDALTSMRQAVKLDPDYLNAWAKIEEIAQHMDVPSADKNAAALNVLRLDPLGRHQTPELDQVTDLPGLWSAAEAAAKIRPAAPTALYRLSASAQELEKAPADSSRRMMTMMRESGQSSSGGDAISNTRRMQTVIQMMGGGN